MILTLPRKDLFAGSSSDSSLPGLCSSDGWFRRVTLGFRATGGGSGLLPPAASLLMVLLECESKLRVESVRVWARTCHGRDLFVMFWITGGDGLLQHRAPLWKTRVQTCELLILQLKGQSRDSNWQPYSQLHLHMEKSFLHLSFLFIHMYVFICLSA